MAKHEIKSNEFSTDLTDDASGIRVDNSINTDIATNVINVNMTNLPNDSPESFDLSNVPNNAPNRIIRVNRQIQDTKFCDNSIRF